MEKLIQQYGESMRFLIPFVQIVVRYLLFAGSAYMFFYGWRHREWVYRKIQAKFPEKKHLLREIRYSILTAAIFALVAVATFWARQQGYSRVYTDVHQHSWGYLLFSFVLMVLLHDTYFYWTHRLIHHRRLFPYFHRVHHLSHNPSPWAAYAFHPLEAIVEAGILPLILFTLPVHPLALIFFSLFMIMFNIMGHLGYELVPERLHQHWLGRWFNTSTHHNMHHQLVKGNYGLYFNVWDTLMGTNHRQYEQRYQEIISREKTATSVPSRFV